MKLEQNDESILFSYTKLPDVFFTEYFSQTPGDYIKVYLCMVFLSKYGKDIKINDLSKKLALSFPIIQEAIKYWEDLGAITKKTTGYIINNLQEIELNKLYKPKVSLSASDIEKNEKNKYRASAIETINSSFFQGIMSPSWYSDIDLWFKKFLFDEQVMIALFNYCYKKSALHKNYVQAVADAWNKNNIKTFSDLETYFENQEKMNKIKKAISKKLGITRALTEYENSYIEKWIVDFGFSLDVIEIALKKTTSKANPSFDYIDKLISNWHEHNLKTAEDVEKFLEEFKTKNKNIEALKKQTQTNKKSNYSNYEQREYSNSDLEKLYANGVNE